MDRPPFGGEDRAHMIVQLAPVLIFLKVVETFMFSWRKFLFLAIWERTQVRRITSGISALVVVCGLFLVIFVDTCRVSSGSPPLGYDVLLCFCCFA